jgi:hypothetical protein
MEELLGAVAEVVQAEDSSPAPSVQEMKYKLNHLDYQIRSTVQLVSHKYRSLAAQVDVQSNKVDYLSHILRLDLASLSALDQTDEQQAQVVAHAYSRLKAAQEELFASSTLPAELGWVNSQLKCKDELELERASGRARVAALTHDLNYRRGRLEFLLLNLKLMHEKILMHQNDELAAEVTDTALRVTRRIQAADFQKNADFRTLLDFVAMAK